MRDYGTGSWDGGDGDCDHLGPPFRTKSKLNENWGAGFSDVKNAEGREPMGQECSKCGATRVDRQLGLEATPGEYVENMVAVFREIRRVLAPHGTVWLNLGDSYASGPYRQGESEGRHTLNSRHGHADNVGLSQRRSPVPPGLKQKDLVGIPWRTAFALQADGWYLRSDIVWSKPNPMPESVTDRPTKSHEYVFLLSKQPRYWFDAEAVREPAQDRPQPAPEDKVVSPNMTPWLNNAYARGASGYGHNPAGRNVRSVWDIATQPYAGAHFATFPEELVRRCLLAGCPTKVCRTCGKPSERILEATAADGRTAIMRGGKAYDEDGCPLMGDNMIDPGVRGSFNSGHATLDRKTVGWTDCGHGGDWRPGVVLDPFMGSGTTALVARQHGRHAVGIELNEEYAALCATRLQQLSLLAEEGAA